MSSPAGAASGANGNAGGDAGSNGEGDGQAQGPDMSALAQQLEGNSAALEEMRGFLQSQPWQTQQQPQADTGAEPEPDAGLDLAFLDDAGYDQQTASQLAAVFDKQVSTQVEAAKREMQQQFESVNERVSERERMEQMRDLVEEFPDMANPEVAKPVVEQAHSLVEANGWDPKLAADPRFWRVAYAAQTAFQAAQEEGSEQPDAAHLEGGAGAAGAGRSGGTNDIVQALDEGPGGGRSVLPFP